MLSAIGQPVKADERQEIQVVVRGIPGIGGNPENPHCIDNKHHLIHYNITYIAGYRIGCDRVNQIILRTRT